MASESAKIGLLWILGIFLWFPTAAQASSWTLRGIYQLALKQSETFSISEQAVKKAEAQLQQVLARALPEFSFRYTSLWQDQSGLDTSGGLGSFTQSPQPEGAFRLKLPLLTGYREIAALRAGSRLVSLRRHERQRLEQVLYQDTASAFYAALLAEQALSTTERTLRLTRERLEELRARVNVGRSREAEVLDVRAEIAGLESQKEDARRTVRIARNLLSFLTGAEVEGKLAEPAAVPAPHSLKERRARLEQRPDLKAKRDAVEVARGAVRLARAGHFPGLDLSANYYIKRVGFREPINWDVNLGLSLPLWSWGAVRGSVREAQALLRQAEKDSELSRRMAEREVKDAYELFVSSIRKVRLQTEAAGLIRRSYELRIRDYRRGLVTNFEVMDVLGRLQRTDLAEASAKFESALAAVRLEIATGGIP